MIKELKHMLIILILIVIIDIPVIAYLNRSMYIKQFKKINGTDLKLNNSMIFAGFITYLLMTIGLYKFIIYPSLKWKLKLNEIIYRSILFGIVIYGIYNFTNKATIYKYDYSTAIIDTLWGSILFTIISLLSINIIKYIK